MAEVRKRREIEREVLFLRKMEHENRSELL
jgi:hypothetical protein